MGMMEKLFVLSGTLWLSAVAFIIYTWVVQARQQVVLYNIVRYLRHIEKILNTKNEPEKQVSETEEKERTVVNIDKNEPLSNYKAVTLPDEVDVKFVD